MSVLYEDLRIERYAITSETLDHLMMDWLGHIEFITS